MHIFPSIVVVLRSFLFARFHPCPYYIYRRQKTQYGNCYSLVLRNAQQGMIPSGFIFIPRKTVCSEIVRMWGNVWLFFTTHATVKPTRYTINSAASTFSFIRAQVVKLDKLCPFAGQKAQLNMNRAGPCRRPPRAPPSVYVKHERMCTNYSRGPGRTRAPTPISHAYSPARARGPTMINHVYRTWILKFNQRHAVHLQLSPSHPSAPR